MPEEIYEIHYYTLKGYEAKRKTFQTLSEKKFIKKIMNLISPLNKNKGIVYIFLHKGGKKYRGELIINSNKISVNWLEEESKITYFSITHKKR